MVNQLLYSALLLNNNHECWPDKIAVRTNRFRLAHCTSSFISAHRQPGSRCRRTATLISNDPVQQSCVYLNDAIRPLSAAKAHTAVLTNELRLVWLAG